MGHLFKLDLAAQEAFDSYLKAKDSKRRADGAARSADARKKEAQAIVIDQMGDHMRALLPDGRIVQRLPKSMHVKAKPAQDFSWEELIESVE